MLTMQHPSRDDNDEVLIAGFGRKGKAKGDIPGVRHVSLWMDIRRRALLTLISPTGPIQGGESIRCWSLGPVVREEGQWMGG